MVEMHTVTSTAIAEIGWENDELHVRYKTGKKWFIFAPVTKETFNIIMSSTSKGASLHALVTSKMKPINEKAKT